MSRSRGTAVATALLCAALAAAGCGLGPGPDLGAVELSVTREYGSVSVLQRPVEASESDTVMRVLEGEAEISTRYGGGYVHSIGGVGEAQRGGDPYDWFFYVDGVESPIGAADYSLHGGERIWWDYRNWEATNHVPAVVGSWPAPFVAGYEGRSHPVAVECEGGAEACATTRGALEAAGVELAGGSPGAAIRVLVGTWARLRSDPVAALVEAGPEESGVFADFERRRSGYALVGLDQHGEPARRLGPGAGLVAATRRYEGPPVWLVTGGTPAAVRAAAGLLDRARLRDHYAVATEDGKETPLPVMPMRSPFAYTPRPGPLQAASPGAAVAYLGALATVAFLYSTPLVLVAVGVALALAGGLAGAGRVVRAATRLGLAIALPIVLVNALVVNRGETVLARLGEWPLLGRVDVSAEAIADGAIFGLRAVVVMIAFAVYSACVDPDRVLRALRPLAGRSALTASLVSRLVPVAAADAGRLRDAARLRGPGAAEAGRAPLARRLLAGSLDRAVDVAATLELRGYGLEAPRPRPRRRAAATGPGRRTFRLATRFDRRFYCAGGLVLAVAIAAKAAGADDFHAYPTIQLGLDPAALALAAVLVLSGLAPLRRQPRRHGGAPAPQRVASPPRGPGAAPPPREARPSALAASAAGASRV